MDRFVVVGCGGHARELMSVRSTWAVPDLVVSERPADIGTTFIRPADHVPMPVRALPPVPESQTQYLLAFGDPKHRRRLWIRGFRMSFPFVASSTTASSLVNESKCAFVAGCVVYGPGYIGPNVEILEDTHVLPGAQLHHDVKIGAHAFIGPGAVLCGAVEVGECVTIGAGAVILPGVKIGREAVIGAGAVVTRDVPEPEDYDEAWAGVPARRLPR